MRLSRRCKTILHLPAALAVLLAAGSGACGRDTPAASVVPDIPRTELLDPSTCGGCHPTHYAQWSISMHAQASDDPVFVAMNKRGQRETAGALGSFCVNCHAPMAVREKATTDGLNLADVPRPLKGVTCYFCHTVNSVIGSHDAALTNSADNVIRGAFRDALPNVGHYSQYSALHDSAALESSGMCGSCHDITSGHGAAIERTLAEWQGTAFNRTQSGSTCGHCHMTQATDLAPAANSVGVKPRRLHNHSFPAVDVDRDPGLMSPLAQANQEQLDTTLQGALCVMPTGPSQYALRVILDNVAAGHNWPSGSAQDRRAWVEIIAYQNNQVIYQSGVLSQGNDIVAQQDDDLWLFRDCMFGADGAQVSMFWNAASVSANTLPGQQTYDANDPNFYKGHVEQFFPRNPAGRLTGTPDRVTMRVRLTPMGQDFLGDLVRSGDLDPNFPALMPTYSLKSTELTWTPNAPDQVNVREGGFDAKCVSTTSFNATANRVPAINHTRCKP